MANRWANNGNSDRVYFLDLFFILDLFIFWIYLFLFWIPKALQMLTVSVKLRHLLLGRKPMSNLDSILKTRDITLLTNVHLVKAMVFPVVMNGGES